MNKIEQLHFDNHDYRDAAEITEQIACEFAEWLNTTNSVVTEHNLRNLLKGETINYEFLFQEFLKTK